MSLRALLIDDDLRLAELLSEYLGQHGVEIVHALDGPKGLMRVEQEAFDVVLLDLTMPGMDGLEVCKRIRKQQAGLPILMLTARGDETDRVVGLELGADDYICKPFSPREVVARVKAQLRRAAWGQDAPATTPATLQLDDQALRASYRGQALDLTPAEYRLLRTLYQHPGRIYSRAQLLDQLHDDGRAITDRAVDSHVRNLRGKLKEAGCEDAVETVHGVGLRIGRCGA